MGPYGLGYATSVLGLLLCRSRQFRGQNGFCELYKDLRGTLLLQVLSDLMTNSQWGAHGAALGVEVCTKKLAWKRFLVEFGTDCS